MHRVERGYWGDGCFWSFLTAYVHLFASHARSFAVQAIMPGTFHQNPATRNALDSSARILFRGLLKLLSYAGVCTVDLAVTLVRIGTYGGSNACQWYVVLVLELLVMASIYSTSNLVRSHMRRSSRLLFTGFVFMYARNHQPAPKQFNPAPQRPAAP